MTLEEKMEWLTHHGHGQIQADCSLYRSLGGVDIQRVRRLNDAVEGGEHRGKLEFA